MDMDLNNRLTEDETLEQAYDIFLELAADNLDPADIILFNLQFEERGGAELFDPAEDWQEHVDFDLNPDFFAEVVIGLADTEDGEINDILRAFYYVAKRSQSSAIFSGANNQTKSCSRSFLFLTRQFASATVTKLRTMFVLRLLTLGTFSLVPAMLERTAHVRGNQSRRYCNHRVTNQDKHGRHHAPQRVCGVISP